MPTDCEINFDENSHGTYFTGQKVSGKVVLTLDKPKSIKGIALKICGYAETSWRQRSRHGHGKERKRRLFQGRVDYLASTTYLVGSENNKHDVNIDSGAHTYNFYCTIPELCPSSFESNTGFIRYVAKVVLLRSKKADKTFSTGFTVLKKVDLNTDTSVIKGTVHAEVVKMVSTGLFSKKPLILRVDIPQNGFVSGQAIMVNTTIDNQSNTPLKGIRFALNLVATFHSQIPKQETRVEKINLCKIKSAPVDKQSTVNFMEILRVPPTPPSCPDLCKIIQISYEVDVMAKIAGVHLSPSLIIPVVIGNVPLIVSPHFNIHQIDPAHLKKLEAEKFDKTAEATKNLEAVSLTADTPGPSTGASTSGIPSTSVFQPPATVEAPLYDGLPPSYDEAMAMEGPAFPTTVSTNPFHKKVEDDSDDSEIEVIENDGDDDEDEEIEVGERAIEPMYPVLEMGILVDVEDNNKAEKSTNPFTGGGSEKKE